MAHPDGSKGYKGSKPFHRGTGAAHPVKGFFNYVVGQLCANSNMIVVDETTTEEEIEAQVDNIVKTATAICDKVHARNKSRLNDRVSGNGDHEQE